MPVSKVAQGPPRSELLASGQLRDSCKGAAWKGPPIACRASLSSPFVLERCDSPASPSLTAPELVQDSRCQCPHTFHASSALAAAAETRIVGGVQSLPEHLRAPVDGRVWQHPGRACVELICFPFAETESRSSGKTQFVSTTASGRHNGTFSSPISSGARLRAPCWGTHLLPYLTWTSCTRAALLTPHVTIGPEAVVETSLSRRGIPPTLVRREGGEGGECQVTSGRSARRCRSSAAPLWTGARQANGLPETCLPRPLAAAAQNPLSTSRCRAHQVRPWRDLQLGAARP